MDKKEAQTFSCGKAVYNPKTFFPHAASLHQAFAHCGIFSTAATRRCTSRVSVSSLGTGLSPPLPVIALVSHYLTNKLIGPRPIPKRLASLLRPKSETMGNYLTFRPAMPHFRVYTKVLLTRSPLANAKHWPRNIAERTRKIAEKISSA
jgi:hypothetical protein